MLLDDVNFNVVGIMDDDHNLTERREYHPYGKRQIFINGGNDSSDYRCTAEIPYPKAVQPFGSSPKAYSICDQGHQGLMHDKETGQLNNRARYLDPILCRYIGRDPLDYIDGNNLYVSRRDNPNSYTDWTGEKVIIEDYDSGRDRETVTKILSDVRTSSGHAIVAKANPKTSRLYMFGHGGVHLGAADVVKNDSRLALAWMFKGEKDYTFKNIYALQGHMSNNMAQVTADMKRVIASQDKARRDLEALKKQRAAQTAEWNRQKAIEGITILERVAKIATAIENKKAPSSTDWVFLERVWTEVFEPEDRSLRWQGRRAALRRDWDGRLNLALDELSSDGREYVLNFLDKARLHMAILRHPTPRKASTPGMSQSLQDVIDNPAPTLKEAFKKSTGPAALRAMLGYGSMDDFKLTPKQTIILTAGSFSVWYGQGALSKAKAKLWPRNRAALHKNLRRQGFELKGTSPSGYVTYKGPNGTTVTVKPTGEVIRVQRVWKADGTGKFPQRQDFLGKPILDQSHSTGHFVEPIQNTNVGGLFRD